MSRAPTGRISERLGQKGGSLGPLQLASQTNDGSGSMLLKKSLSTADQNFSRPLMRFSDKNVRDLVS
jgi:hypothetical protein